MKATVLILALTSLFTVNNAIAGAAIKLGLDFNGKYDLSGYGSKF